MSRIKQKKQGVRTSLVFTNQDKTTGSISFDGTDFDISAPITIDGSLKFERPVVTVDTAATYAVTAAESGTTFVLAKATGTTFTLPTASVGLTYKFFVSVSAAGGSDIIITDGTDNFEGIILNVDKDQAYTSTEALQAICKADGTPTTITLNGGTTGGLIGSCIEVTAINADRWMVSGILHGDSNVATCFS